MSGSDSLRLRAEVERAGEKLWDTEVRVNNLEHRELGGIEWEDGGSLTSLRRVMQVKAMDDATLLTTGDGKMIFVIPTDLDGLTLVEAAAYVTTVSSSGLPTIQLRKVATSADMLTTRLTIDVGEKTSYTAAAAAVINATNAVVATGDLIAIDIDVAGTGSKGLGVALSFV